MLNMHIWPLWNGKNKARERLHNIFSEQASVIPHPQCVVPEVPATSTSAGIAASEPRHLRMLQVGDVDETSRDETVLSLETSRLTANPVS
jgi:hypothetical protein